MASSNKTSQRKKRPTPFLVRCKHSLTIGIKSLAESSWMKFTTGIVLLTSGLDEAIDTLFADISALELGAHHGVMVLGFVNILSSLPDMLDGLTGTFLADDEKEAEAEKGTLQEPISRQNISLPKHVETELKKAA